MFDSARDIAVAIIVFNRPLLTKQLIDKLSLVEPKRLYVIADGPKESHGGEELNAIREVRNMFEHLSWSCEIIKVFAGANMGLRARVLSGLDYVFKHEDRAIILEDDCHPAVDFFHFVSETSRRTSPEMGFGLISGTNLASPLFSSANRPLATSEVSIWGWFTWSAVWSEFRMSSRISHEEALKIIESIDVPHYRRSLRSQLQVVETLDSWAFWFALFLAKLGFRSLQPPVNLVENVGFGPSSTHTKFESWAHQPKVRKLSAGFNPEPIFQTKWGAKLQSMRFYGRWLQFPLVHPVQATARIRRFLEARKSHLL